jgi:hypothetical protein
MKGALNEDFSQLSSVHVLPREARGEELREQPRAEGVEGDAEERRR